VLAWRRLQAVPDALLLEGLGDYIDKEELKGLPASDGTHRQHHEVTVYLGPAGSSAPDVARLTGLSLRVEPPDLSRALRSKEERRELAEIARRAARGPDELRQAIAEYASIEAKRSRGEGFRAALHFALAGRPAATSRGPEEGAIQREIGRLVREERALPPFILALRAAADPRARLSDEERVRLGVLALSRPEPELARWGGMMLAQGLWPGAAEAVLEALAREEAKGAQGSGLLRRSLRLDAYRLLGAEAQGLSPAEIQRLWPATKEERRDRPFTYPQSLADHPRASYFAEAALGNTVFLLEVSSSMLRAPRGGKAASDAATRLTWARGHLVRAIRGLSPETRFGMVAFDAAERLWSPDLRLARPEEKALAVEFLAQLRAGAGSSLLKGLEAAFRYRDVETVVLLADGHSQDAAPVEMALEAWNYLRGVRLVTYGFAAAAPRQGAPLELLERLAYAHFGWHRMLPGQ
jgi:hypothetical protein